MNLVTTKVAGTTFENRPYCIQYILKNQDNTYMYLARDPYNRYDKNAIKVMGAVRKGSHVHVGYIPKDLAKILAPRMDAGYIPWVETFKILGAERGLYDHKFGIRLLLNVK